MAGSTPGYAVSWATLPMRPTWRRTLSYVCCDVPSSWKSKRHEPFCTIARGLVIDHWRREELERAYLEALAHLPENETPSPESRELVFELLEGIAKMLDGLKPKVRQAFLLAQCEGLTHKDIVVQMGLSLRSVERYVAEALYHCYVLRYEA